MTVEGAAAGVERAVASGNTDAINRAVHELLAQIRRDRDGSGAVAAGELLQSARRFDALLKLADTAARMVPADEAWELWPLAVTGLIELDATLSAERLVKSLLADPACKQRGRLLGRLGRIKKDQFVDTGDPQTLDEAIHAYVDAYAEGANKLWAGVNAIALRALAARKGFPADDAAPMSMDELFTIAATSPMPREAWSITTELELRIARGEDVAALQPLLTQLFTAPDLTGFTIASLARQLDEIWDVDPSETLMVMLGERTLASGAGEVVLPRTPDGYERTFGSEFPIPIELYKQGLDRARSVGSLLVSGAFCVGTVFALEGADLHPSLAGRMVLVTNEHVVPDPTRGERKPQADEMQARFDGVAGPDGTALCLGGLRAIWRSPREQLDITLLITDDPGVEHLTGLDVADKLPPVRDGSYVYVIGHPGGGGLQLSIRGNDLIDEDDIRLHYKAPTAKGSSGSPVFDEVWKLIGVHHKGSTELAALNGASGTYPGNEGIAVLAVRDALSHDAPEL